MWIDVKMAGIRWEVKCHDRYLQMAPGWEGTSVSLELGVLKEHRC